MQGDWSPQLCPTTPGQGSRLESDGDLAGCAEGAFGKTSHKVSVQGYVDEFPTENLQPEQRRWKGLGGDTPTKVPALRLGRRGLQRGPAMMTQPERLSPPSSPPALPGTDTSIAFLLFLPPCPAIIGSGSKPAPSLPKLSPSLLPGLNSPARGRARNSSLASQPASSLTPITSAFVLPGSDKNSAFQVGSSLPPSAPALGAV